MAKEFSKQENYRKQCLRNVVEFTAREQLVMNTYNDYSKAVDPRKRKISLIAKRVDHVLADFKPNETVLDVGCAHPIDALKIVKKFGSHVTGVDFSPEIIKVGREWVKKAGLQKKIKLVRADAAELPFPDNRFDRVVSFSAIEHIPIREKRQKAINEMARVCKPGGYVAITVPNFWNIPYMIWSYSQQKIIGKYWTGYEYLYTPAEIKRCCRKAGLKPVALDSDKISRAWILPRFFGARMGVRCAKL